jgi:hypothetical protein
MAKSGKSKKLSKKKEKNLPKKVAKKVTKAAGKKAPKKAANKTAKKSTPKAEKKSTKRFLILYHVPAEAMAQIPDTPEERERGMALWKAWGKKVGNKMADFGTPLFNGKNLNSKGVTTPSTKQVAGYSLLDATDFAEVLELISGNPHISGWHPEATIEIHETMFLPGM